MPNRAQGCDCQTAPDLAAAGEGPRGPLPPQVLAALGEALADERKALATYEAVMRRFGPIRPFVNIADAERRHIAAVVKLYEAYGETAPNIIGKAEPAALTTPLEEICKIGVQAEIENVALYDDCLLPAVRHYPYIEAVLTRLRNASWDNHKPAFERCVARGTNDSQCQGAKKMRRKRCR
ncbi:MAG: ferritin-like domain-containing protein [Parvularcula sp.]